MICFCFYVFVQCCTFDTFLWNKWNMYTKLKPMWSLNVHGVRLRLLKASPLVEKLQVWTAAAVTHIFLNHAEHHVGGERLWKKKNPLQFLLGIFRHVLKIISGIFRLPRRQLLEKNIQRLFFSFYLKSRGPVGGGGEREKERETKKSHLIHFSPEWSLCTWYRCGMNLLELVRAKRRNLI